MSTTAYFRPVLPKKGTARGSQLKYLLAKKHLDHDGSLCGKFQLDNTALEYLNGLKDAGVPDANKLIEGIEKHELIEIYLVC